MEEIEAFRYRSQDAWRAVTRIAVREARLAEIKQEMMHCKKLRVGSLSLKMNSFILFIVVFFYVLQSHFENNPNDMGALRHDKALHTVRLQSHLKDVPDYIIPPTLRRLARASSNKARGGTSAGSSNEGKTGRKERTYLKRKDNPLLSFEFDGFKKKAKK